MQAPPAFFMELNMIREPEFQSLTPERKEVLYKLLCVEPDTLDRLTRVTGWGRDVTQQTLLQLVADGRVSCKNGGGVRLYRVRDRADSRVIVTIGPSAESAWAARAK